MTYIEAAVATDTSEFKGIGYQEARRKRFDEGFSGSGVNGLESQGNEEYLIYFGRARDGVSSTGVRHRKRDQDYGIARNIKNSKCK